MKNKDILVIAGLVALGVVLVKASTSNAPPAAPPPKTLAKTDAVLGGYFLDDTQGYQGPPALIAH